MMRRLRMQQRPCWLLQRRPPLRRRYQRWRKLKKYDFLALAKEEKVPKMEETQKV